MHTAICSEKKHIKKNFLRLPLAYTYCIDLISNKRKIIKKAFLLLTLLCAGMASALTVNWTASGGIQGLKPFMDTKDDDYRMAVLLVKGNHTDAIAYLKKNPPTNLDNKGCLYGVKGDGDDSGILSRGTQKTGHDTNSNGVKRLGVYYEFKDKAIIGEQKGEVTTFNNAAKYSGDITLIFSSYKVADGVKNISNSHAIDLENMSYYEIGADQWTNNDTLNLDLGTIQLSNGLVLLPEPTVLALLALGVAGLTLKRKSF